MFVSRDSNLEKQHRQDQVHKKAAEYHITPRELFARAFMDSGSTRAEADKAFATYSSIGGSKKIPEVVVAFCDKPLPDCRNPNCSDRTRPARFTRASISGRPVYFCSIECMNETPIDSRTEAEISEGLGLAILERVRIAMSEAALVKVPPHLIRPLPGQPRTYFNPERQSKLVESLASVGQMMPGIIRSVSDGPHKYELLDGERRWRGVIEARLPEYRAMLVEIDDAAAPFVVSVISNFNREGHTVLEETDAVLNLHDQLHLTMKQIGRIIGKHEVEASQLYGLRRLIPEVRDMLDPHLVKGHPLPKSAAIEISKQPAEKQLDFAERIMRNELTVTGLREHIHELSGGSGSTSKRLNPAKRRQAALARARLAASGASTLWTLFTEEETRLALEELTTRERDELVQKITAAATHIAKCSEWIESNLDSKR